MKKLVLILTILFSVTLAYAEEQKTVAELQNELDHLQSDFEKKQKEISEINVQLSALSLRIHDTNAQLQIARDEEAANKHES